MEMYIGCTDPTQAKSRLLIVLLRRLPKSGCKEKQLTFSNGNDWTGQSGPPSKVVLNIPVGRNQNGPLHLISYRKLPDLRLNGKRLMQETVAIEVPPQKPYY